MTAAFDPSSIEQLPSVVPIFPLSGATLLPGTVLPLNIFEPRYLSMVLDAIASHRYIAMVQPCEGPAGDSGPAVYDVGCAGRITGFNETDDGRLLISLKGTCRYRMAEELDIVNGYRRIRAQWSDFASDLGEAAEIDLDRANFRACMETYFDTCGLKVDWAGLEKMPDARMVDFLAMNLPFSAEEKQALLEATDVMRRNEILLAVATMAGRGEQREGPSTRH